MRAQSYTASATAITAVGAQEEYQLGQALRALYINASSPADVAGLSHDLFVQSQVAIQADAGGEGGVIFDSTVALTQVRPHSPRKWRFLTPAAGLVAEHEPVHLVPCERYKCDLAARGLPGRCSSWKMPSSRTLIFRTVHSQYAADTSCRELGLTLLWRSRRRQREQRR
jgi:hypothetical protein